jgi:hemerythrin-like domain-containing protein
VADLFKSPAPSFDNPLGLLAACHGRIEQQLQTLQKLPAHLAAHGWDDETQDAAERVTRYFSTSARHHHDDEEKDLFPRLRGKSISLDTLIDTLLAQHRVMHDAWARLAPLLSGRTQDVGALRAAVATLTRHYEEHLHLENNELLPAAEKILTPTQLDTIGTAMAARRGVTL